MIRPVARAKPRNDKWAIPPTESPDTKKKL